MRDSVAVMASGSCPSQRRRASRTTSAGSISSRSRSRAPPATPGASLEVLDWQRFYFYKNPVVIPTLPGSFSITCMYDTTGAMDTIHFGEGTGDEMCIGGLYMTY